MNDKITSSDGLNLNSFEGSKKFNDYNFNQNANYNNSNNNNNNNASNKSNNMSGNECSEGCWKIFQPFAKIKYELSNNTWSELIYKCRNSRQLVLLVVFIALFFDNMLLTTVVPIIPEFLFQLDHPNETAEILTLLRIANLTLYKNETLAKKFAQNDLLSSEQKNFERERYFNGLIEKEKTQVLEDNWKKVQMNKLNTKVGLMFASKPVVQLLANPFIGTLTNKIGYSMPMFAGFIIMFVSTLTFAFAENYPLLFLARAVQGVGSACSSVAGLGMLADRYPDDIERGNAMGIALGGLAMGVLVGPPFGGVIYQFFGKEAPFLILASLGIIDGILQLFILQPSITKEQHEGASIRVLIRDPYILITAGAITFANMGIAMMEPSLPIWMMSTMNSANWQLGVAFLPASISYLIGTNLFGHIAHRFGRWLCSFVGLIIIGISLMLVPFASTIYGLIVPNGGLGFAIGMVDSTMMPTMGYLVDIRHSSVYGGVYAIADIAFCLGFALGPALSGVIVSKIGFPSMLVIIGIIGICYSPLMFYLKNPPAREENMSLIMNDRSQTIKYVSYNNRNVSNETSENDDY